MNMVGFISGFEKRAKGERIIKSVGKVVGKAKRGPKSKIDLDQFYNGSVTDKSGTTEFFNKGRKFKKFQSER